MPRIFAAAIVTVITSLYYFPIIFAVLPFVTTKQIIAVIGMIIWVMGKSMNQTGSFSKGIFCLSGFAVVFSLICFFSVAYNETQDYTYAAYIVSMWVWLAGAYGVCWLIKKVHGVVSFEILSHYLVLVCVVQCFLALIVDYNPGFKMWVDTYILQDQEFLTEVKRLYGIGAMLDTAGIRFSIALVLLSNLIVSRKPGEKNGLLLVYLFAFAVLTIVGNMISRTTTVGVVLGLLFIAYRQIFAKEKRPFEIQELVLGTLTVVLVCVPIVTYFYDHDAAFHKNLRFGFEGLFSLVEQGGWEVGSNEQLGAMIVFPEKLKTYLIGDGYFNNPVATDPYFTGEIIGGYYMGTDIGYLRFIFYCGTIGLLAFSCYILKAVGICIERFPSKKEVLLLLGVLNFIVWLKVSTDIFLIFALLLVAEPEKPSLEDEVSQANL